MPELKPLTYQQAPARLLARNAGMNLLGYGVPFIVSFFAIPVLVRGLGVERFGILTLVWMIVGYFGFFDLGIGRATTKYAAEAIAHRRMDDLPLMIWTSLGTLIALGLAGGFILMALSPLIVSHLLNVPPGLKDETQKSFFVLAASLPLVLGAAGGRGVLEALQKFVLINTIKTPLSAASFAAPLLVLPYSNSLYTITAVLVIGRLIECATYFYFCVKNVEGMKSPQRPDIPHLKKMLAFGGWVTVTNILSPIMNYLDRFIIGGMLTMSAVAYYATPYDFVNRLAVIPGSLLIVVFPSLCAAYSLDSQAYVSLYNRTLKYILLVMTPVVLLFIVLAHPFLNAWLGPEFAAHSTLVFQLLSVGMLLNALAQVPFAAIHATGRADLTAKLHMVELPIYLCTLWLLTHSMGITGAAVAWLARILIDAVILHAISRRLMPVVNGETGMALVRG